MTVAGRLNGPTRGPVRIRPCRDETGQWRLECEILCHDLGYEIDEVWPHFDWLADVHECNAMPREAAEQRAFADITEIFDKRGVEPN